MMLDFGSQFEGTIHYGGEGRCLGHQAATLGVFIVRRQKEMSVAARLAFPFDSSPDASQWDVFIHIQGG